MYNSFDRLAPSILYPKILLILLLLSYYSNMHLIHLFAYSGITDQGRHTTTQTNYVLLVKYCNVCQSTQIISNATSSDLHTFYSVSIRDFLRICDWGQSWNRVSCHRVSDYVRVGSGLGSKLFTDPVLWPGFWRNSRMIQQQLFLCWEHEHIVHSRVLVSWRSLSRR